MRYITIDTGSQVPIYAQIMDQIRSLIRDGRLLPHSSLPSVRQLASDLQINPNTVAKAYSLLDREGIVEAARRRGTVVTASAPDIARKAVNLRVEETADRVLEEIANLGVDVHELLEVLKRRRDQEKPENT